MGLIKINELRKCKTTKEAINKMFEMCYTTTELLDKDPSCKEKQMYPAKVDNFLGNKYKNFGFYMKHKKIDINNQETRFDSYFKASENIYYKLFNTEIEKNDMEEHLQEGRATALQALYNYLDRCTTIENNIDISTVDKFCNMLEDKDKSTILYTYLLKSIKSTAYKSLYQEGNMTSSSRDFYTKRVTENGIRKSEKVKLGYVFLDSYTTDSDEDLTGYSILDIHNQKEGNEIDVEGIVFNTVDTDKGTLQYILDNRSRIFTKSQLDKINNLLSKDTLQVSSKHRKRQENDIVKKAFQKLGDDKYCYIENEQLRLKNIDFLVAVENIINAPALLEQFDVIKDVLLNKRDFTNTLFIDIIYSLNKDIIRDLVYCLTEEVDANWLESDGFNEIINALVKEYNYQVKNAKLIYKYNKQQRVSKEDKIKNYIEKNCFFDDDKGYGYVAKSPKGGANIPNMIEITDFISKIYSKEFNKKQMKSLLNTLGYNIDIYKKVSKNNIPSYKIFRI